LHSRAARHGWHLVGLGASGHSREDILHLYPYLEAEDLSDALTYAAWRADEFEVPIAVVMKIVVDMNLSPAWSLRSAGTEAEQRSLLARILPIVPGARR